MYERRTLALASEFCELARVAKPNEDSSRDAQKFFKKQMMGLTDDQCNPHKGGRSPEETAYIQDAYMKAMSKVLRSATGGEFFMAATYDMILGQIPKSETGIRHTLHKVAIDYGLTPAKR